MISVQAVASLPPICRSLLQIGLGVALQSTLLLGLGLLAGLLLRRRGPTLLSLLYRITLAGTVASAGLTTIAGPHLRPPWRVSLPAVAPPTPGRTALDGGLALLVTGESPAGTTAVIDPRRLPDIPAPGSRTGPPGEGVARQPEAKNSPRTPGAVKEGDSAAPGRPGTPPGSRLGWLYVAAVALWGMGAALLLSRLLLCQLLLQRLRRRAVPFDSDAAPPMLVDLCRPPGVRSPLLLTSPEIHSPFLTGLWRPAILLPADGEPPLDGPALWLILAHELVHLARRDCGWALLARLASALGWPQPLLWILCRRLEQASEEVCDLEVVHQEGDPRGYARCLLALAERFMPSLPERAFGLGVVPIRSSLGRRIERLLAGARHPPLPLTRRLRVLITLAASMAVVLGLFLAAALAAPPGEKNNAVPQALQGVRELDKPVTYTETKIPLGELVQKVAADTGAPLTAAPDVADEPVAVVVTKMPARELLEQLADLLDYQWHVRRSGVQAFRRSGAQGLGSVGSDGSVRSVRSDGSIRAPNTPTAQRLNANAPTPERLNARTPEYQSTVYEIWQDLASQQREEALRNALRADVIRRFQDELQRHVEMAGWSPERLRQFLHQAQHPTPAGEFDANERARRFMIAREMMSPISRSVAQLLSRLSPEQWATVRDGQILTLSTDPQPGELPMPAETARVLRAAKPTPYPPGEQVHYDDPNGPEQWRQIEQSMQAQWAAASGYRVTIQINPDYWRNLNMLQLTAAAKPFRTGAPPRSGFFDAYEGTSVRIKTEPEDPMSWEADKSMPPEAALAHDPIFGTQQRFQPEAKPRKEWYADPGMPAMFRLRDLLPDLARTYHVQFIADAYTPVHASLGVGAFGAAQPQPLYQLLSRCASITHRWDRVGNLIRLRSRTWFLDRPREIPLRLARHWKELIDQHGALPLETYLEMVRSLTDLQLENLANVVEDVDLPQTGRWFEIGRDRYALRLYAALTPDQQQALWQGKTLLLAQMTPAQRELFLTSLEERSRHEPFPMRLEHWSDGRLSLEAKAITLTVERPAEPAGARPARGAAAGSPSVRPPASLAPGAARGSSSGRVVQFSATRLTLQLGYAPNEDDETTLAVAR